MVCCALGKTDPMVSEMACHANEIEEFRMRDLRGYAYLASCLFLVIYSQIIMKWQIDKAGTSPSGAPEVISYVFRLLLNPWVISGAIATFLAGIAWLLALSRLELSHAYPFISLTFIFMLFASAVLFNEPFTWQKMAGSALIAVGIVLSSQG